MKTEELIRCAERALKRHGLALVVNRFPSDRCFDLAAKGEGMSIVVKTAYDMLDVPRRQLEELCAISNWASATPLILAERAGEDKLDNDAVYVRGGVYAVSLTALRRSLEGDPPLVEVGPAGCYVYIDGEAMKEKREKLGLSVGELARLVGVSRMTIYSYERGRRRTTPDVAYRLEYVLGIPIVVPIDPLRHRPNAEQPPALENLMARAFGRGVLGLVAKLLSKLKLIVRALFHAPFDMLVKHEEEMIKVALNVIDEKNYDERRINSTRRFAELMGLDHLVVRTSGCKRPEDAVSVAIDELKNIRRPEDFAKLLT